MWSDLHAPQEFMTMYDKTQVEVLLQETEKSKDYKSCRQGSNAVAGISAFKIDLNGSTNKQGADKQQRKRQRADRWRQPVRPALPAGATPDAQQ